MKRMFGRIAPAAAALLCVLAALSGVLVEHAGAGATVQRPASRQPLIGTWRLVSIQVIGPNGRRNDPFYNADPEGVLIYDASGWMSVQIAGSARPTMEVPASRSAGPHSAESAQTAAAVLDTYYAYAANWDYDKSASTVTHHVRVSLIPNEINKSYTQSVRLEGDRLIFTVPREDLGAKTVQEKVWKRIDGPAQ